MDQIKPIIEKIVTHRFWVGCGLVVILTIVVAYLAIGSVSTAREKHVADIKSKFTSTQNLAGIDPSEGLSNLSDEIKSEASTSFPNDKTLTEMDRITDLAKIATRDAWEYQYNQQTKLLVFPEDLEEEVRASFRRNLPIEQKLPKFDEIKDEEQVLEKYRRAYGVYIKERLPQLAKKIGAKWRPSSGTGQMGGMGAMGGGAMGSGGGAMGSGGSGLFGSGGSGSGSPMGSGGSPSGSGGGGVGGSSGAFQDDSQYEDDGTPEVVVWSPTNENLWLQNASSFMGRNNNKSANNTPTTHQVMYLQEDLWVLEAIFDVIKKTNGDADANDLASIKTIDHILLGQGAGSVGDMSSLDKVGAATGANMADMMKAMGEAMSNAMGSNSRSKKEEVAESEDPAHFRYVDKDFQLMESNQFHSALSATGPDEAYLQVAKRIPVRIGFQMKEVAILELLEQCANSDPPIEVRQVRINRHVADDSSGSKMGGAGMDPTAGTMGAGAGPAGDAGADVDQDTATDVIGVEIYGVVYIYNPVPAESDNGNILKLANPNNADDQTAMRSPTTPTPTDG